MGAIPLKVLITGGTGFIGGHVVDRIQERGYTPLVFDHRRQYKDCGADWFCGDIKDPTDVSEAMHHVDAFIHLAAALGTQETIKDPRPAVTTNMVGGLNVLEAAAKYGVPGANIAVGNFWMANPYAISKNSVERFIEMYNRERGTKINNVRAMNAYGPRQVAAAPYGPSKVRKIAPSFICRALNNHTIEIYGSGEQVSDMVYVTDVAEALVRSMEAAVSGDVLPTVEVGPAVNNTVNEVAELVVNMTGSQSEIRHLPMRPGEEPDAKVCADVGTLLAVGMSPDLFVSLDDGMRATIDYFREELL